MSIYVTKANLWKGLFLTYLLYSWFSLKLYCILHSIHRVDFCDVIFMACFVFIFLFFKQTKRRKKKECLAHPKEMDFYVCFVVIVLRWISLAEWPLSSPAVSVSWSEQRWVSIQQPLELCVKPAHLLTVRNLGWASRVC